MAQRPWNYYSAVPNCETCDGTGKVHSHRRPTIDDPYPVDRCEDCDRPNAHCCPVCGFGQHISGADCLACETVAMMFQHELADFDPAEFADAIKVAVSKALADTERRAA